jgi:starch synthase (maltosyl-transferring)
MNRASSIRACYVTPAMLRPTDGLGRVFDRCAALGFSSVVLPHLFVAGDDWTHSRLGDPDRLAPALASGGSALDGLAQLARMARERDLDLVIDVRLDQLDAQSPAVAAQPDCFRPLRAGDGPLPDPRRGADAASAAVARFRSQPQALERWWQAQLGQWIGAGVAGFRCLWPQQVPADSWHAIIAGIRQRHQAGFWAWTPGTDLAQLRALADCGFDAAFASLAWWDYRSHWYALEDQALRAFPQVIAVVEDPQASAQDQAHAAPDAELQACLRARALAFAAHAGDGLLVPMRELDDGASDRNEPDAGALDRRIIEANRVVAERAAARRTALRPLLGAGSGPATAWLLQWPQTRESRVLLVNADARHIAAVDTTGISRSAAELAPLEALQPANGDSLDANQGLALEPAEVRVYRAAPRAPVVIAAKSRLSVDKGAALPRVAIERITPSADGGRFAVKRTVGERVVVQADVFSDGHDLVTAAVLWRACGERQWQSAPMRHLGNDRWSGEFTPDRLGRHEFTVEAWRDEFATARMDLEKRRVAGKLTALDVDEVCLLVSDTAAANEHASLRALAARLSATDDLQQRAALLLEPDTAVAMSQVGPRPFLTRCATVYPLEAERLGAGYSSWYELFPRSQSASGYAEDPQRHGTFDDVITRLPAIRDMGFDVLYMPPIHPIGRINRKGRNNSTTSEPGEPGSPYAIGAEEGGHDAIHPELGTLEDFRRLVAAAANHGLELALDFAIQCSPDHPWLREHPDWFAWRADGSIRYAENPPKKYEDIVNVDFYAKGSGNGERGSVPDLWLALRDVVAFWVNEGVRLFRVDNPHTKPFPFWEWMIGDIRATHPDVVFLSEAFTRPRLMYRLAKVGFSQSYTYFTWRNTKAELTEYLTELSQTEVKDYFRPHFFVNTPDINPVFLQTAGRPGHLIRAALATTLSGLWGMYSGFELCEATPVPGKEDYLDSEKYQLRQWDWQRPGHIIDEITRLNHLRRLHPALQTHLDISFYNAFNDNILYFGKRRDARGDMVLVAINLDPHHVQEADFELPLWEWGLPDHGTLQVEDLWRGTRTTWQGKRQHLRLDPGELPFAIWRVGPDAGDVA